jgi:hypothetical protein
VAMTPIAMGIIFEKYPSLLFGYSYDQKFYFFLFGMLLIIFIWELLLTIISMKFCLNIIKIFNKYNNKRLSITRYTVLLLLPIINIIIPFRIKKIMDMNNL